MVFLELGMYGIFFNGIKSIKMTNQELAKNQFLTTVTITYLVPGTTWQPANKRVTGLLLDQGPLWRSALNVGAPNQIYNPVFRNSLDSFLL